MAKKRTKFKLKPLHLIISGLLLIIVFSAWRYHSARILSFNAQMTKKAVSNQEGVIPVYIKSYPIGVDVEIEQATIVGDVWAIHPNSASYLIDSSRINSGGNIIVYGHNKDDVLGPIRYIKEGAEITLKGEDNNEYIYQVVKIDEIDPDNIKYLQPTEKETLTLYTCTGFLDSKRHIVIAERVN